MLLLFADGKLGSQLFIGTMLTLAPPEAKEQPYQLFGLMLNFIKWTLSKLSPTSRYYRRLEIYALMSSFVLFGEPRWNQISKKSWANASQWPFFQLKPSHDCRQYQPQALSHRASNAASCINDMQANIIAEAKAASSDLSSVKVLSVQGGMECRHLNMVRWFALASLCSDFRSTTTTLLEKLCPPLCVSEDQSKWSWQLVWVWFGQGR